MQPLRRNHGRYCGERIQIDELLHTIRDAAKKHAWSIEDLPYSDDGLLLALTRTPAVIRRSVYLSAGIHGDEPAGPASVLSLLTENDWPDDVGIWLCPCLNPTGFPLNTRENKDGDDLNRDYRHARTAEIKAHTEWLRRQPCFDLGIHLHEDWEAKGFYLYSLNPHGLPDHAGAVIDAVSKVCPIDPSAIIDDREANGGIIRPSPSPESRPEWPEAFYMVQEKTKLSYTLEAPSDFPMKTRVMALSEAVKAFFRQPQL